MMDMAIVLVRYCEIGLKSTPVRKRFESLLRDNMLTMLAADGVEAIITYAEARFYVETDDIEGCVASVRKVFGIASISVAEECSAEMQDICRTAEEYSVGRISKGQSFAVKARREGTHPYTSMEVGKEAGSAIFIRNESLGIKVDLTAPDKVFYIEVRNNRAFVFDKYIGCPGGLPLGCQGRVIAEVDDIRGIVSAWMMMKRGCRVMVHGDRDISILRCYAPMLRELDDSETENGAVKEILGRVKGTSLDGIGSVDVSEYDVPVYFPTVGMTDDEVDALYQSIDSVDF